MKSGVPNLILTMDHELVLGNSSSAAVNTLPNTIIYLKVVKYLNIRLRYFNEVSNTESSRLFWETCKPYFSNKHARGDSKIMLIESDKMLLKNEEVAKEFNQYFGHITDSFDLYEFPNVRACEGLDDIYNIVYKFRNHEVS